MKREFWQTVTELVEALQVPGSTRLGLKVTSMTIDLPVEMVIVQTEVGFQLLIDALHYRWDAGLRPQPAKLTMTVMQPGSLGPQVTANQNS